MDMLSILKPFCLSMTLVGLCHDCLKPKPAHNPRTRETNKPAIPRTRETAESTKIGSRWYSLFVLTLLWLTCLRYVPSFWVGFNFRNDLLVNRVIQVVWLLQCAMNATAMFIFFDKPNHLKEFIRQWGKINETFHDLLKEESSSTTKRPLETPPNVRSKAVGLQFCRRLCTYLCQNLRLRGTLTLEQQMSSTACITVAISWCLIACNLSFIIVFIFSGFEFARNMMASICNPFPPTLPVAACFLIIHFYDTCAWVFPLSLAHCLCSLLKLRFSRLTDAVQTAIRGTNELSDDNATGNLSRENVFPERADRLTHKEDSSNCKDANKNREDLRSKEDSIRNKEDLSRNKEDLSRNTEDFSRTKEDPSRNKEDSSRNKEEPSRNKEDSSRNKEDHRRNKKDSSRNKEDSSRNKEDHRRNKKDSSRNKEDSSRNKEDPSRNKEDLSRNKEDPSRNKEDPSRNKEDSNRNKDFSSNKVYPSSTSAKEDKRDYDNVVGPAFMEGSKIATFALSSQDLDELPAAQTSLSETPVHGKCLRNLGAYRMLHLQLCSCVGILDRTFSRLFMIAFATNIPLLCFIFYNMISTEVQAVSMTVLSFWAGTNVAQTCIISLAAAGVHEEAHSALEHLYFVDVTHATVDQRQQLDLFLSKLSGPSIGFTALGIITVTKEMLLTLGGLVTTYFFLLLDVKNNMAS